MHARLHSRIKRAIPVLVLVENAEAHEVTRILNAGASDLARLPLDPADLLPRLRRLKNLGGREFEPGPRRSDSQNSSFRNGSTAERETLLTQNAEFKMQLQQLPLYAKYHATALITGET